MSRPQIPTDTVVEQAMASNIEDVDSAIREGLVGQLALQLVVPGHDEPFEYVSGPAVELKPVIALNSK